MYLFKYLFLALLWKFPLFVPVEELYIAGRNLNAGIREIFLRTLVFLLKTFLKTSFGSYQMEMWVIAGESQVS